MIAVVSSQRAADKIGRVVGNAVAWILARLGRDGAPRRRRRASTASGTSVGEIVHRRGAARAHRVSVRPGAVDGRVHRGIAVHRRPRGRPAAERDHRRLRPGRRDHDHPDRAGRRGRSGAPLYRRPHVDRRGISGRPRSPRASSCSGSYVWFLPIPFAWILLKLARRGQPMLPTTTELRSYAASNT